MDNFSYWDAAFHLVKLLYIYIKRIVMAKTALLLGATGATGSELLKLLLDDSRYSKVKVFARSSTGIVNAKLEEHITDVLKLEAHSENFTGDEVFCCIGTTKAKTPDKEMYRKIDYGIPVSAAKLARLNDIPALIVISAMGADASSSIFYNRVKGEMQEAVLKQGIAKTHILQPSLIVAERDESRPMEKVASVFMKLLNPVLPKKYRSIKAVTIATAMLWLANNEYPAGIITSDVIQKLGRGA